MMCKDCEYEKLCFDPLKILNGLKPGLCKQGRHKAIRSKRTVIINEPASDSPVEKV